MLSRIVDKAKCFYHFVRSGHSYEFEHEQPDNYQIFAGYLYVVNGKVWKSPFTGTVRTAKNHFANNGEIVHSFKNCDTLARKIDVKLF